MLGKIGLNEAGVGVLLNILKHTGDGPGGVPIHMIFNRVLSRASTLAEALEIVHSSPTSSSSIITVITAEAAVQVGSPARPNANVEQMVADSSSTRTISSTPICSTGRSSCARTRPHRSAAGTSSRLSHDSEADRAATGGAEPAVEPTEPAVG